MQIDLPHADVDRVKRQLQTTLELGDSGDGATSSGSSSSSSVVEISAKHGLHIDKLLEAIVTRIPAPKADPRRPWSALLFDSWYDDYKGVICLVAVLDGKLRKGSFGFGLFCRLRARSHTHSLSNIHDMLIAIISKPPPPPLLLPPHPSPIRRHDRFSAHQTQLRSRRARHHVPRVHRDPVPVWFHMDEC